MLVSASKSTLATQQTLFIPLGLQDSMFSIWSKIVAFNGVILFELAMLHGQVAKTLNLPNKIKCSLKDNNR